MLFLPFCSNNSKNNPVTNNPLPAPVLYSPANGAAGQYLALNLTWVKVTNAAMYAVQVATDSAFSGIAVADSTVMGDSATISARITGGLSLNTTYYWRAQARNGGSVGAWSNAWSFTTMMATTTSSGMRRIAGGTFRMGDSDILATPLDSVTVSSFYIDTTPVTQADYGTLMSCNPSFFAGVPQRPVEQVTWFDAVLYCNARSRRDGKDTVYSFTSITGTPGAGCSGLGNLNIDYTKYGYRLPTEAEWEYACRAGNDTTDYYWGKNYFQVDSLDTRGLDSSAIADTLAADTLAIDSNAVWYYNSPDGTQPVATKKPNTWGLYDMSGNVWEWCNDWQGSYSNVSQTNPTGPTSGSLRIMRGGSWFPAYAFTLCAGYRGVSLPEYGLIDVGFRVLCGIQPVNKKIARSCQR